MYTDYLSDAERAEDADEDSQSHLNLAEMAIILTYHETEPDASQAEIWTSWSLFILIMLLVAALFASYVLQTRRIQAVHETVMSIFAGMAW